MRKFIIKRKKETVTGSNKRKKSNRSRVAVLWMLALSMLMSPGNAVHASEDEDTASYVYHKHVGSSGAEGGCYTQPIYHAHEGTEENGGSCYETAIYHQHIGDSLSGGACYETAVYHEHNSDWCYSTKHTHGSECYRLVNNSEYGCKIVDWWDTSEGDYGDEDYKYYVMSCGQTIHGTNPGHYHQELNCNGTGGTNERVLSCTRSGEVEGYGISCTKTTETIEYYTLSCPKTTETIEFYERNCGKEEGIAYGKITVTKSLSEDGYSAFLSSVFEEMNGGGVKLSDSEFLWFDSDGNHIGSGGSITVTENGTYRVEATVTGEDISGDGLTASVIVSEIRDYVEEIPKEVPDNEADEETDVNVPQDEREKEENGSSDTDEQENDAEDREESTDDLDEYTDEAEETEEITPLPVPTEVPVLLEVTPIALEPDIESETVKETEREEENGAEKKMESMQEEMPEIEEATATPVIKKQTVTVRMDERQSEKEEVMQIQTLEEKKTFFNSPVVKVITLTTGTFAALGGLAALFYLFRWSVAIYNDDGEGNLIYLGRCMVKNAEDGYLVTLSDEIAQKAVTNRYCIKTGLFRFGRGEEELLIEKQAKRISHVIEKELYVVI